MVFDTRTGLAPATGFAFFDFDETLVSMKSMLDFQMYWYRQHSDPKSEAHFHADMQQRYNSNVTREELNRLYYRHFAGRTCEDTERCARQWFDEISVSISSLLNAAVIDELRAHQSVGREAVIVSGSFPAILKPYATLLGVKYILATRMQQVNGVYTGEILHPQTIGPGKAIAINLFLARHRVSADSCYAYGDDISDSDMLAAVGHPTVVRCNASSELMAENHGWRIIDPN